MALRQQYIPKVRYACDLVLTDGTRMEGDIFLEATARMQDMLNDPKPFFPFVDSNNVVHLINKAALIRAVPRDR
jgi:hypothetical protein